MERFDLIAIGGGTAGLVSTAGAAALGLRAALIEREALGGDCLWTGCVPSKALIASAKLAQRMRHADRLGLVGASPAHTFQRVMERMRAARATVAHHDDPQRFRDLGVDVRFGEPTVVGPKEVAVDGKRLATRRIVIATGAVPSIPPIEGVADTPFLTHLTAFDQDTLPEHLIILGGGPIGLEFAQIYRRLGARVTVVEMLPQLLPREEPDAAEVVAGALREEGIELHLGHRVERVARNGSGRAVRVRAADGTERCLEADELFIATGRRPNTEGLGLEAVGVALDRGAVRVDAGLRSTVPSIWAAGDVTGGLQFTHVADYQAKLVLRNSVFPFTGKARYDRIPWVTYTDPEVARVGLTEAEAHEREGDAVAAWRYDFDDLDRAIVDGETRGFVKIVTGRKARILGATIVAGGAGNLLTPIVLAMQQGIALPKLSQLVYPYPTMAEGIKRAADAYYRAKLQGRSGIWLRRVVRWLS